MQSVLLFNLLCGHEDQMRELVKLPNGGIERSLQTTVLQQELIENSGLKAFFKSVFKAFFRVGGAHAKRE